MGRLLALLPLSVLAGCFTGGPFYSAGDSRPAIADGSYRLAGAVIEQVVTLSRRTDGMVDVREAGSSDGPNRVGFVPLDAQGRRFAVWTEPRHGSPDLLSSAYGLLERRANGGWTLHAIHCDGIEALAVATGAQVEHGPLGAFCSFPNRESLERALRRIDLAAEPHRAAGVRLEPVAAR